MSRILIYGSYRICIFDTWQLFCMTGDNVLQDYFGGRGCSEICVYLM